MKKLIPIVLVLALGLFLATGAWAEDYKRAGLYAGFGGIYSVESFSQEHADFDNSFGIDGRFGYRFFPFFAAEVEMFYNFGFDSSYAGFSGEAKNFSGFLNAKAYLPMNQFQPYAIGGVGFTDGEIVVKGLEDQDISETDISLKLGAGLDFYFSEHLVLFGEFAYVLAGLSEDELKDFDFMTLIGGLMWRF